MQRWRCWATALAIHAFVFQGLFTAFVGAAKAAVPDFPLVLCTHDGARPASPLDTGHAAACCELCCLAPLAALPPPPSFEPTPTREAKLVRHGSLSETFALIPARPVYRSRAPPA